jgi:hypothetical protein
MTAEPWQDATPSPPTARNRSKPQRFVFVGRESQSLNYWEGE